MERYADTIGPYHKIPDFRGDVIAAKVLDAIEQDPNRMLNGGWNDDDWPKERFPWFLYGKEDVEDTWVWKVTVLH